MRRGVGSRKIFFNASLAVFLLAVSSVASAEFVTDSSGQQIDSALDTLVSEARTLRMDKLPGFDVDKSISMLEKITSENPEYFRAWYNLGLSYLKKDSENYQPVIDAFQHAANIQAADANIQDGSFLNSFGWVLLNARRYADAETQLKKGLELGSNRTWTNSALNYNLGRLYFEQGDFAEAQKFLDVAADNFGNPAAIELRTVLEKTKADAPASPAEQ